jgi:hypothetical protein
MMCTSIPASAAKREIFRTIEPPPFSSCHRLRLLEPTTIWVICLVTLEVFEQFFFGLVGQEAECEFPQGDQVVGAEEVCERLGNFCRRVDVAVQHATTESFG